MCRCYVAKLLAFDLPSLYSRCPALPFIQSVTIFALQFTTAQSSLFILVASRFDELQPILTIENFGSVCMKNLKPSDGILSSMFSVMKLCFMALSMVSVLLFVKPVFAFSCHFVFAVFPQIREKLSACLTRAVLYVLVNCIILAIVANSSFQHRFNLRGSSHEEHNQSASQQKQQQEELIYVEESTERSGTMELEEEQEEPIYVEKSVERSGTMELEEQQEKPIYVEESTERSGTMELEEEQAEVSSAVRSERIRTPDVRREERPLATSRFNTQHRKAASVRSSAEAKSLGISRSKKKAETLESTWKAITEGRGPPLTRQLRKSDTWETVHRADATDAASHDLPSSVYRKIETWSTTRNRTDNVSRGSELAVALRKEPSPSQDELNRKVEAFIAKMNNDMKLQREQSLARYMEMVNRGAGN